MSQARKKQKKPDKYAGAKIAAIPLLLCVLAYALFAGDGETTKTPPKAVMNTPAPSSDSQERHDANKLETTKAWPEPNLDFLKGPNPFASFRGMNKETTQLVGTSVKTTDQPDNLRKIQEELQQLPLRYHFKSGRREVIMLGDQVMESGDKVSPNLTLSQVKHGQLIFRLEGNKPANVSEID